MEEGPLTELLIERFEAMPSQLQVAARFVLDHPKDVALMSMREQAHRAGVSHSTMMRLARWLGLDGYDDMRALYAQALREPMGGGTVAPSGGEDDGEGYSHATGITDALAAQVASLGEYGTAMQLVAAADVLVGAERLFSLGVRAEQPVASQFARAVSIFNDRVTLLEPAGSADVDVLRGAGPKDAMLVIGVAPYARATIEIAEQAARCGVAIVAITDSRVSPLARIARESVVVTARSASFFPSITPALAAAEVLAALIAARSGMDVEEAQRDAERHLAEFGVYWTTSQ